jgi:uncharacterized membrane-anchored protein
MGRRLLLLICIASFGQTVPEIHWQFGPLTANLGTFARLRLPKGMIWADGGEARRFLEFTGNPPGGSETGVAGPPGLDWFAVVSWRSYSSLGFEARNPQPEEIAAAIQAGSASANRERAANGRETLEVLDWGMKPSFDSRTGRLEFRLKTQESGGRRVENRFVYFLGTRGVVEIELVTQAGTDTSGFEQLLGGIGWQAGEQYEEPVDWTPPLVAGLAAAMAAALGFRMWRQRGQ